MGNRYQCQFIPVEGNFSIEIPSNTYISKLGIYAPPFQSGANPITPIQITLNGEVIQINTVTYMYEVSNVHLTQVSVSSSYTDKLIIDYILEEEVQNG